MVPWASTMILSTALSSAGFCVITTTVIPLWRAWAMACASARSPAMSRFEFGSSSTTSRGVPKNARASATRCFCPPDSGAPSAATKVT